ncbi:hypothetical protein F5Y18DRAFT_432610 [Xylariaceae sp. FL1019]|nr:hypothetical protein F5Y18DRAFT_432610 [Xylariaceae sp. FL1019]
MTNQLSQIASQLPGYLTEHSNLAKRRHDSTAPLDTSDLSQFFDFKGFYGEPDASTPAARSRSDASSDPGLTSGPSEDDGASPGPSIDSLHIEDGVRDDINKVRQQDDRFTIPQREIRPKGAYPHKIHLDVASPTRSGLGIISPPASPPWGDRPGNSTFPHRGRRSGPLPNPVKVAEMRKIGACLRCRTRKVVCDGQSPCEACVKASGGDTKTAWQLCNRSPLNRPVFPSLLKDLETRRCRHHQTSRGQNTTIATPLTIVFDSPPQQDHGLCILVNEDHHKQIGTSSRHFSLCIDPGFENKIVAWASSHMRRKGVLDFPSALDEIARHYHENTHKNLYIAELTRKTYTLRCMFYIWKQNKFWCRTQDGTYKEIPREIHQDIKIIVARSLQSLEGSIIGCLKTKGAARYGDSLRLPLWACLMEMIVVYLDILCLPETMTSWVDRSHVVEMLNSAVVMCEPLAKKKAESTPGERNADRYLAHCFDVAERLQVDFYETIVCRVDSGDILIQRLAPLSKNRQHKRRVALKELYVGIGMIQGSD